MYEALTAMAGKLSMGWQDIPELVSKQTEELNTLQKELQAVRQHYAKYEALELVVSAEQRDAVRLVKASFVNRPVGELRLLAEQLKKEPDLVAFLVSFDGQKVSLLVTCAESTGRDARQLLSQQLTHINGRGGGDGRLAQGGGSATEEQYHLFLQQLDIE
jgi:alanyl-tRNA synthetase